MKAEGWGGGLTRSHRPGPPQGKSGHPSPCPSHAHIRSLATSVSVPRPSIKDGHVYEDRQQPRGPAQGCLPPCAREPQGSGGPCACLRCLRDCKCGLHLAAPPQGVHLGACVAGTSMRPQPLQPRPPVRSNSCSKKNTIAIASNGAVPRAAALLYLVVHLGSRPAMGERQCKSLRAAWSMTLTRKSCT